MSDSTHLMFETPEMPGHATEQTLGNDSNNLIPKLPNKDVFEQNCVKLKSAYFIFFDIS